MLKIIAVPEQSCLSLDIKSYMIKLETTLWEKCYLSSSVNKRTSSINKISFINKISDYHHLLTKYHQLLTYNLLTKYMNIIIY